MYTKLILVKEFRKQHLKNSEKD